MAEPVAVGGGSAGAPTPVATGTDRLVGIDLARALAFGGMLLAHFAVSLRPDDPGWLQALDDAADGRAAPLFCVLLGLGAGLLTARGAPDRVVVRRGLALFALGVGVWPYVERVYLILPQYGLLLAVLPLLRRLPTRALVPSAALAFLVPSLVVATGDDLGLRAAPQPDAYADVLEVAELAGYLLWTGAYPVVGWVGFVLVGLWLARQPLGRPSTQRRLLAAGTAVALTQPLVAALADAVPGDAGVAALLGAGAHSNHTAWYVLASATAVAAVAACLVATRAPRPAVVPVGPVGPVGPLGPVAHLGQLALTAYLAHLALGAWLVWPWIDRTLPPLAAQVAVVAATFAAFTVVAALWRRRWRRGPFEALVRTLAG